MRSAWRTVEKRCEIRIVVAWRVAARMRSKISASPRTSSCAVGSSSSTTPGAQPHRAQRARQRHALPLPARQVGAALVAARQRRVERRRGRAAPASASAARIDVVGRAGRRDVVAQRQLEADEVLEHRGDPRAPGVDVERRAGRRRRPRSRPPAGRRAGTAAWRASSCPRRSARRWPATSPRGWSGRSPSSTGAVAARIGEA